MYRDRFGTDWCDLDRQAMLRRSYALGVASALGCPLPKEYDRVRDQATTSYDRVLVELSFNEGKCHAVRLREDRNPGAVWTALLSDDQSRSMGAASLSRGPLPSTTRLPVERRPGEEVPTQIRIPRFLLER